MKFAVISDIHGNLDALHTTLEDIKKSEVEKIFILGDLALAGPEPSETINFIKDLSKKENITIIQGNTDEMIVNFYRTKNKNCLPPNEIMAEALKYTINILKPDQIDFLESLPAEHSETIGNLKILFVHGSPRKNNEDILPTISEAKLEEIIKDVESDLIFCGHTHLPAQLNFNNKTIVNAGSIGRPLTKEPQISYVIVNYSDYNSKTFVITNRLLEYNKIIAAQKLEKLSFKGSEKLAQMLINPSQRYPQ